MNALRRVCHNGSFKTKLKVANGVIMSKLSYLITVWGGAQEYLLDALQVQQLSAARVVCGFQSKFWSRRRLLKQVNWLSVRQLIFYHTVMQTHKTLSTGRPRPLYNNISSSFPYLARVLQQGRSGKMKTLITAVSNIGLEKPLIRFLLKSELVLCKQ